MLTLISQDLIRPDLIGPDFGIDFVAIQKNLPKWLHITPSSWTMLRRREEVLPGETTM